MSDNHLPTADLDFIISQLEQCDKVISESRNNIGPNMITLVLSGLKPMHKRYLIITHNNGIVNFNQASSLAIRFQFMGSLLEWFLTNRGWKEGAYIVRTENISFLSEEE